jgi:hypothetical protein
VKTILSIIVLDRRMMIIGINELHLNVLFVDWYNLHYLDVFLVKKYEN